MCCNSNIDIGGATIIWVDQNGKKEMYVAVGAGSMVDGVDLKVVEYGL